jgi:hypothetical protein
MTDEKKFEELTSSEVKELKIEFAPGCFDHFEGTQEELDEMIAEIQKMVANGSIHEHSRELTEEDFNDLPEEVKEQLLNFDCEDSTQNTKRKLQ